MEIPVNKYQTPITEELLKKYPEEVVTAFMKDISSIEFIRRLISPDRKRAKDLERDDKGRIIVDIANPHILEDMEYFRPAGNFFKKHKCYTLLKPNSNPNSEYGKWLYTELDRIRNGMVRPSDGEWITGEFYYYLNYSPIKQSLVTGKSRAAQRVLNFPAIYEGTYLWEHYVEQARNGGIYNDFQGAENAVMISKRGAGKSYNGASALARIFTCGDSKETCKEVTSYIIAYQKEYLIKDGTLNKFTSMIDFAAENTQFPSRRLKNSLGDMDWKMGYIDLNTGIEKGTKNEIMGISIKDDPDKPRGKRGTIIAFEEFGSFPSFIDTWNTCIDSVREGNVQFGTLRAFGTGGSKGNDFSGALEIIYNPRGYYVYALPNVFDYNAQGKQQTVFFFGAYLNRFGCYNQDGVSDVVKALLEVEMDRYTVKYGSADPLKVTRTKAEHPITIQDAIMKTEASSYPIADINTRIEQLDSDPSAYSDCWTGTFTIGNKKVDFAPGGDPIRIFPHKDNKLEGAVEIYKMPIKDSTGEIPADRYIAGLDPYDDDISDTLSLGSLFIMDMWTDEIVLEYTGRPKFAEDFYELCRRCLLFFNARLNYENNKKGIFAYFSRMNSLYLMTDRLKFLEDMDMVKGEVYGNKQKGTLSSPGVKKYGRDLIRRWLLKPYEIEKEEVMTDGEKNITTLSIPQLYKIKSRALLKELALWNPDGNFDRHDSLVMLMLLREDRLRLLGPDGSSPRTVRKDYIGNDKFFTENYDDRLKYLGLGENGQNEP